MKRRSEHLVQKRDGRVEFLRATKLARSIHLALRSVGVDEDWRALEVSAAVLTGLRYQKTAAASDAPSVLTTADLATAVQHVLVATGQPAAAVAFDAVASERQRRRSVLAGAVAVAEGPAVLPSAGPLRRLGGE